MNSSSFKSKYDKNNKNCRISSSLLNIAVLCLCAIWCVAVARLLFHEGEEQQIPNDIPLRRVDTKSGIFKSSFNHLDSHPLRELSRKADAVHSITFDKSDRIDKFHSDHIEKLKNLRGSIPQAISLPQTSLMKRKEESEEEEEEDSEEVEEEEERGDDERSKERNHSESGEEEEEADTEETETDGITVKSAWELAWPPVLPDGSIPREEGSDVMMLTGLQVPRFWTAKPEEDLNTIGTKLNGLETIFLMIASFRDFQCPLTITLAYARADHPERLFVGVVEQNLPDDVSCTDTDVPCEEDPEQMLCKYRDQISVYKMDAGMATGPVTARHIGDRLYRGQYFAMQLDAHCVFVNHWDTDLIEQWRETENEMAVLSTYMSDTTNSTTPDGELLRESVPILCNSEFEGDMPERYLRHGTQPEIDPLFDDTPALSPFWAAGLSFARGHFIVRVPYDGYQPMVFQGEEISLGIRGFTHGYDFYAPRQSVVFHEYTATKQNGRDAVPKFWDNPDKKEEEETRAYARSVSIIKMATDIDASLWDHREVDKYGLGDVRSVDLFYKIFLVDPVHRNSTQLCPFIMSGIMHTNFTAYLREDGLGIDYTYLEDFDTKAVIAARIAEVGDAEDYSGQ